MKTIKIYALPSHQSKERTSGVDFARIIQPMRHLDGYSDGEVKFKVDIYDIHAKETTNWKDIAKEYDVIYFNYLHNPWGYAAMGAMARGNNTKLVLDLDDSLWHVKSDNSAHSVFHKGSEALKNFTAICRDVDLITTTSGYLRNVIVHETGRKHDNIKVFPNYIDLSLYSHKARFNNDGHITLLHHGSTTHFNDLMEDEFMKGVDRIMSEYPNVDIKFVGAFIPKFRQRWGLRYQNAFGHVDIYEWIKGKFREYMDEADILVVPLTDDLYNRCKSPIKFLETSSAGIPGVYQNIRQYQEVVDNGRNGFLASRADEWYKSLKTLIDDVQKRREVGEEAYKTVVNKWQMKDHIKDYAEMFKKLVDK
jgi:glycosyltransferase involved in cell wall biosynthesis